MKMPLILLNLAPNYIIKKCDYYNIMSKKPSSTKPTIDITNMSWNIIDKYFKSNPYNLVAHHLDSYNDFFSNGIYQVFKENNPFRFLENVEKTEKTMQQRNECLLYLGGKDGNKIYFGKP